MESAIEIELNDVSGHIGHDSSHDRNVDIGDEGLEPHREDPSGSRNAFSLPPADGGRDAWLFLAGSFMIEGMVWGKYPHFCGHHKRKRNFATDMALWLFRLSLLLWCFPGVLQQS